LGLLAGSPLTPWLSESLVLLGASVPFAQAADLLHHFTGVRVGAETVRRLTEAAGAAQLARETTAVADLERTLPDEPPGPALQLFSVDGAFAPLVGGGWAEVKTLVVGEVVATADGPRTQALSYFSRLSDAETFGRLATVETHRRGTTTAGTVVAVTDGARWCQGVIDWHRPDAVRILDFPHAVEHLSTAAQAVFGPGTATASEWLGVQRHALRHGQEDAVLRAVAELAATPRLSAAAGATVTGVLTYLTARREHLRYERFSLAGYPIGSGCVESANKLVVEARLKGAGMHWARANVNPLLALRTLLANGRWDETWPALWQSLCAARRRSPAPAAPPARTPTVAADPPPCAPLPAAPRPKTIINGRPTADHPWKRGFASHAKP
jgi:hypothetical protein